MLPYPGILLIPNYIALKRRAKLAYGELSLSRLKREIMRVHLSGNLSNFQCHSTDCMGLKHLMWQKVTLCKFSTDLLYLEKE